MYITQEIADKIKSQAKLKKITMKELLFHCELNINAISEFAKGKQLSCLSLARIADYLDCSVDYLLGRTDEQTATYYTNNVNGINFSNLIQGSSAVTVNSNNNDYKGLSNEETEILDIYRSLNIRNKTKFLNLILNMEKEENN